MDTLMKNTVCAFMLGAAGMSVASVSKAQDVTTKTGNTDQGALQEIVVTAEKRTTNLQKTPVSVTAITGAALRSAQIRTLTDVKGLVPAMQMGENDGQAQITIRGIGISAVTPALESAVALNMNEVYVSRPVAQLTGLFDVGSLEVLRGPQGTLYGRNATAGAVNVTTVRPTETWSGYGKVTVGNYAAVNVEAAVGGPIIGDTVLLRIAGIIDKRDGYGKNLVTGNDVNNKNSRAIRATLVIKPTPNLRATIIGEYYKESDNGAADHYFGPAGLVNLPGNINVPPVFIQEGGFAPTNEQDVASPRDSKFDLQTAAVTGIIDWSSGPFSVRSITAYRDQKMNGLTPLDAGSTDNAVYLYGEPAHQFSQELQLHYDTPRLHTTAGLYYFNEFDDANPGAATFRRSFAEQLFGLPPSGLGGFVDFVENGGTIRTKAKAAFGQITYEVLDGLSITGGIRYSEETKRAAVRASFGSFAPFELNAPPSPPPAVNEGPATFKSTTPKFGINYQISPRTLLYASYSKGFKAGGFDTSVVAPAYNPEKLTDYEGGIKTTFLDGKMRLNVGGFYYDYTDLQVTQVIAFTAVTQNAATATIYGGEVEISAKPNSNLKLDLGASYLHSRYDHYTGPSAVQPLLPAPGADFSGHKLNNAPDFSGHTSVTYIQPLAKGSISARAETEFSTRTYFTPDNVNLLSQGGYVKANLFLTYNSDAKWHATAFVRNLTDITTRTAANVNASVFGSPARGSVAAPRTFGLELGYEF